MPQQDETEQKFAQRRLAFAKASLPPGEQPDSLKEQSLLGQYAQLFQDHKAQAKLALPVEQPAAPADNASRKRDRDRGDAEGDEPMDEQEELQVEDIPDDYLDNLYAMQHAMQMAIAPAPADAEMPDKAATEEDSQAMEARRAKQRDIIKQVAAQGGGVRKVFNIKGKKGTAKV